MEGTGGMCQKGLLKKHRGFQFQLLVIVRLIKLCGNQTSCEPIWVKYLFTTAKIEGTLSKTRGL